MNFNSRRICVQTSHCRDQGTDYDHNEGPGLGLGMQGGGPGPSRAEMRRLSQLSKGYGMSMGYSPRYLTRGGTSRHPHTYSLQ